MNYYEHTYITTPELSTQEIESVRKKITDILEKNVRPPLNLKSFFTPSCICTKHCIL